MPIDKNFKSVHEKKWEINFSQCAPNGALNYTDLCNLLQLTAAEHADLGGISFTDMQEFNQAWVLSRMRLEIDSLPKWRDSITVKTWIVSLENSRSIRVLEVYNDEKKIISSETFWVVINTKIRRPEFLALPHEHFEEFPDQFATKQRVKKIHMPKESKIVGTHRVVFSDLDVVNHVNNVKYLEWCLDFVEPKILLNQTFKSIDMNFLNELLIENEVEILCNKNDNTTIFSVMKADKNCFSLAFTL
ncbi:acyl-[acyl-carrier-protein] thioesterase [Flavobacterium sp. SM2513]|uniref:acyl-[acyl-carrier-protein] thioesterase n=1 Tax=Flavobacterium sp. SM2513 TaxID=3424766 RepID=UPI003D7F3208